VALGRSISALPGTDLGHTPPMSSEQASSRKARVDCRGELAIPCVAITDSRRCTAGRWRRSGAWRGGRCCSSGCARPFLGLSVGVQPAVVRPAGRCLELCMLELPRAGGWAPRSRAALLLRRAKLLTAHGPAEEFANGSERHLAFAGPFRRKWVE
jgi:hypothetical protein